MLLRRPSTKQHGTRVYHPSAPRPQAAVHLPFHLFAFSMASRPSKLTDSEETLLTARQAEYRSTKAAGKLAFRLALAKHFVEKCGLEASEVMIDFFEQVSRVMPGFDLLHMLTCHTGTRKCTPGSVITPGNRRRSQSSSAASSQANAAGGPKTHIASRLRCRL